MRQVSNGLPRARPFVDSARMAVEPIHMLIEHEGQLVEIGEVDQAEDEIVLDSTRGSPARVFSWPRRRNRPRRPGRTTS